MSATSLDRRRVLGLLGTSLLAAGWGRHVLAARPSRKVVVVGAGILGAAIGYELARRGAEVTILEKAKPAAGTTGDSFAYLNASTKSSSKPYFDLNAFGLAGWRRWQHEAGAELPLQWGGAAYWRDDEEASAKLQSTLRIVQGWGYGGERIDADDLRRLAPKVVPGKLVSGAFYDEEGAVDPVGAVDALLDRAKRLGAVVRHPVDVTGFLVDGGRVRGVRTRDGDVGADAVVLAAGLGSQALAQSLDVALPLTASQGVLVHTAPQPRLLDVVVFSPRSTIRQTRDGRIVSSSGHEGSASAGTPEEQGRRILGAAARVLPQVADARIERVSFGQRVLPSDTFPVLGFAPKVAQLYVAVTHSGMTLAPAIGRFAAQEILDGIAIEALAPFRPGRFG